jgi:hypothetical protein
MTDHTSQRLSAALKRLTWQARSRALTLRDLADGVGPSGAGGLLMLMGALCAVPTFGLPVATVVSIAIAALGAQIARGGHRIELPGRLARMTLDSRAGRKVLYRTSRVLSWVEQRTERRWSPFTSHALYPLLGALIIIMALIIVLPIPLGNLAPSLATILIGAGLMAKDGLFIAAGIGASGFAMAVTGAMLYGGAAALQWIF